MIDEETTKGIVKKLYRLEFNKAYRSKMAQKLGFLITDKPQAPIDVGTHLLRVDPSQEFRQLTENELETIESLLETMAKTGSDWTDTFRLMSQVNPEGDNSVVLEKLCDICAPLKMKDNKMKTSSFSPAQLDRLKEIL